MRLESLSIRTIARRLGRSPNAISYELRGNEASGAYHAVKADRKASLRRKNAKYQGMKVAGQPTLKRFVDAHLYDDLSPEAIAGRLKRHERHLPYASKNSIRRYIASAYGGGVAWHRMEQRRRRGRHRRRPKTGRLSDRVFIDRRPHYIQKRKRVGDAEADFIVSGKTGQGIILSVADRKTRAAFLERIVRVTVAAVHRAFGRIRKRFPELASISTDNDVLFQKHPELARLLGVQMYFCHPYHSWEKGTVENVNRYVRRDIPKGSDIARYTSRHVRAIEAKLNRRPMAVLGYRTPQEVLDAYRKRKQRAGAVRKQPLS